MFKSAQIWHVKNLFDIIETHVLTIHPWWKRNFWSYTCETSTQRAGSDALSLRPNLTADYREDAQLGRIIKSTADYCLNYMDVRTVFISAGLSLAWCVILSVLHYVVLNRMHTFALVDKCLCRAQPHMQTGFQLSTLYHIYQATSQSCTGWLLVWSLLVHTVSDVANVASKNNLGALKLAKLKFLCCW